jgi:hypothetical protein
LTTDLSTEHHWFLFRNVLRMGSRTELSQISDPCGYSVIGIMARLALHTDVMQARHTLLDDGVKLVRGTSSETPQTFCGRTPFGSRAQACQRHEKGIIHRHQRTYISLMKSGNPTGYTVQEMAKAETACSRQPSRHASDDPELMCFLCLVDDQPAQLLTPWLLRSHG